MTGKSPLTATDEQRLALEALANGSDRAEADRARAMGQAEKARRTTRRCSWTPQQRAALDFLSLFGDTFSLGIHSRHMMARLAI